jgi:hypothetical protein
MRAVQLLLAALVGACALAGALWWLAPDLLVRAPSPAPNAAAPAVLAAPARPAEPPARVPAQPAEPVAPEPAVPPAPRTGDLAIYDRKPMSTVPHQVARAWGLSAAEPSQRGRVGAALVVDPGITDAELMQLGRDLLAYHRDAKIVAIRIYDSEDAAGYDRETDGGALADQHLVGRVVNDPVRGLRGMFVRGKWIEP